MADPNKRFSENARGPYYVDQECIDCNLCARLAPENFAVNLEKGHDYVCQQPITAKQESQCIEAMESCPVEAIGNDGLS